jgi:hypothetical protein
LLHQEKRCNLFFIPAYINLRDPTTREKARKAHLKTSEAADMEQRQYMRQLTADLEQAKTLHPLHELQLTHDGNASDRQQGVDLRCFSSPSFFSPSLFLYIETIPAGTEGGRANGAHPATSGDRNPYSNQSRQAA